MFRKLLQMAINYTDTGIKPVSEHEAIANSRRYQIEHDDEIIPSIRTIKDKATKKNVVQKIYNI